jgi:hypothetical protein
MLLHRGEDMQWQSLSLQKTMLELALGVVPCFYFYNRAGRKSLQSHDRETGCGAELL